MSYADKDKQREYQRKWLAGRRRMWLMDKVCIVCDTKENLEIDHIDPKLKVSHRIWSWRQDRLDIELSKCQVLCKEHHNDKTFPNRHLHGSNGYAKGCKCVICKSGHAKYQREYQAMRNGGIGNTSGFEPEDSRIVP